MKRIFCVLFISFVLLVNVDCKAEQTCNPNYNSVITGMPYCKGIGTESLTTKDPDTINNAWKPDNNSTTINNPAIFYSPFRPPMPPYGGGNINTYQSSPSTLQQNYFDNASPQVVPNRPSDSLPLEIPGSNNRYNYY